MNRLERAIAYLAPQWAERRAAAALRVLAYSNAYESVNTGRLRKRSRDLGSGNTVVAGAALPLRDMARQLERNHDLARGILSTLVRNVVGPNGIAVEPAPQKANGDIDEDFADELHDLYENWCLLPEVTREHDWASGQRLLGRSWFRDGEALQQLITGFVPGLDHGTTVPFSIELIEADLLPMDYSDASKGILQGVERNAWNRAVAYHLYKQHPGDPDSSMLQARKRVSADVIRHIKLVDRIGQVRGVSAFASVLSRLDDLKDYEESERIAAKIAASMAAVIKKGDPSMYAAGEWKAGSNGGPPEMRQMMFGSGMIFDDLRVGESIETIDTNRPNVNLPAHRDGQLRAVAAGVDVSFSSASKNYNGTYSAQRQELVEQFGAYAVLQGTFTNQCVRPTYRAFVAAAVLSGKVRVPKGIKDPAAALYIPPQMPWIDPTREADAYETLEANCYISGDEVVRRRGGSPRDVLKREKAWRVRRSDATGGVDPTRRPPAPPAPNS